jgi:hypothetical protein
MLHKKSIWKRNLIESNGVESWRKDMNLQTLETDPPHHEVTIEWRLKMTDKKEERIRHVIQG